MVSDFNNILCPCNSGIFYNDCCKPFHDYEKNPESALQLMRSRYAAYVMNMPNYIINTTHPGSPHYFENVDNWKKNIEKFSREFTFKRLDILDFKAHQTVAVVVFTAHATQNNQDATFTEKSYFEKIYGKWLYRKGDFLEGYQPSLITTDQLRILPLAYYGDPVLRKKADLIPEITDGIHTLIEDMVETMDACDGMGLAAPQVHHSIQLFVARLPIETADRKIILGDVEVFINPVVSSHGLETWAVSEACLSIPTVREAVERPKEIVVEYTNRKGERIKKHFSGWPARVILHENDHIQGVLFVDHLKKATRKKLEPRLQKLERRIHKVHLCE